MGSTTKGDFQMTINNIIRAWEDPEYRKSLSDEERALLPEDPVGQMELTEDELAQIKGAANFIPYDSGSHEPPHGGPGSCPNTKAPGCS
jgi:mersacidin/lichenicidin family type 2 lantibiotic